MQGIPILVIDDDATTIKLITETLQPLGYSIITAANGDEGLVVARKHSPSLIFINLAVPGTDGLKICKSFMSIVDAPIVLLTMREGKYDPRYKSQYGIVDFFKKPINSQELTSKIGDLISHRSNVATISDAEDEDVDAIEIAEDEVPSASELAASVASYTESEEPLTSVEEVAEVTDFAEADSEEDVTEAVEIMDEVSAEDIVEAAEIEATDETHDEEGELGEWSIPEDEAPSSADLQTPAETPTFEDAPPIEDTPTFGDTSAADEAPSAKEMDWDRHNEESSEERSFGHDDVSEDSEREGVDVFDEDSPEDDYHEEDSPSFGDEGPYELPSLEEKEYEIRPAALERAKRRKSKSKILIPIIALILIVAVAAAFFVFLPGKEIIASVKDIFASGEDTTSKPAPEKPAPAVAKKVEPAPVQQERPPAPTRKPAPPTPAPAARKPAPPKPAPAVQKPAPPKPAPVAKKPAPPTPAPATKIPAPTKSSPGTTYYVQFGAFRSKDNAIKFQKELKDLGYDTFIKEITSEDNSLNLVLLSDKFSDKWTAFKQARQIKETSDIGTAVHME